MSLVWLKAGGEEMLISKSINKTCISLISKCSELKSMKDFRPISCCNVVYKIISKVMANKLKGFLGSINSVN